MNSCRVNVLDVVVDVGVTARQIATVTIGSSAVAARKFGFLVCACGSASARSRRCMANSGGRNPDLVSTVDALRNDVVNLNSIVINCSVSNVNSVVRGELNPSVANGVDEWVRRTIGKTGIDDSSRLADTREVVVTVVVS